MENLNAEHIANLLEVEIGFSDGKFTKIEVAFLKDALSLIKELTEEVASWKETAEGYQKLFEDCAEDRAKLTEENERLREKADRNLNNLKAVLEERNENAIVADTVRKMQERLKIYFGTYALSYKIPLSEALKAVNQIAKEMSEESQ